MIALGLFVALCLPLSAQADDFEVVEVTGAIEWAAGPADLPGLGASAITPRLLMAYGALPAEVTSLAVRLRRQEVDLLAADLDGLAGIREQIEAGSIRADGADRAVLDRLIAYIRAGDYLKWQAIEPGDAGMTPQSRYRGQGRLVLLGPDGLQVIDRSAEASLASAVREQLLFDGTSLEGWTPFAYNAGVSFEENAKLAAGALALAGADGLGWAKLGIWHQSARLVMPRREDAHQASIVVEPDPADTGISLALHPEDRAGNDPWDGNALRIQVVNLGAGKGRLNANRQTRRIGSSPSSVDFPWPEGESRLEWVFRPDQVMEVWLAGVRIGHFPLEEDLGGQEWTPHVYAEVPNKNLAFRTRIRRIALSEAPFIDSADTSMVSLAPFAQTIFDGRLLSPRWALHFAGRGRTVLDVMSWRAGALGFDWKAEDPVSLAGMYTSQPFLVLDRFDERSHAAVDVRLDGAASNHFEIAFQSRTIYPGNRPSRGAYVLEATRGEDGQFAMQARIEGDKDSVISIAGLEKLPDAIRFVMTRAGIAAEWDGQNLGPVQFPEIFDGAALRMFVNAVGSGQADTRLILKRIDVTRTTQGPLESPAPAPGVAPLPRTVLFDGRMSDWWIGQDLGDAQFAAQHEQHESAITLYRREQPPNNNRVALVSAEPLIFLDERIDLGTRRVDFQFDHADPEFAVEILLATNPRSTPKSAQYAITLQKRPDGGLDMGLKADHFSYGIWTRSLPAGWDRIWNGNLSVHLSAGRIDVRLDDDIGLSALTDRTRNGSAWHLALRPGAGGNREPGRFTLSEVTTGWQGPEGMSNPQRWHLVDEADFDPEQFVRDLAGHVDMSEGAP